MFQHLLLELRDIGVGCRMVIGPFGSAGVLMIGITGTDSPMPIIGLMPGMGLLVVRVEFIGEDVRIGTLGIMGTFGIVPMPANQRANSGLSEHLRSHKILFGF